MDPKDLFTKAGLDEKTVANICKNKRVTADLTELLHELHYTETGCDRTIGNLLYSLVGGLAPSASSYRSFIGASIAAGKLKNSMQLAAALNYAKNLPMGTKLDEKVFDEVCGVGIEVTEGDIKKAVHEIVESVKAELLEQRYLYNFASLLFKLKEGPMKWANGKDLKDSMDAAILELLGPKTEADNEAFSKRNQKKGKKADSDATSSASTPAAPSVSPATPSMVSSESPSPAKANVTELIAAGFEARDMSSAKNSARLIKEHETKTKGLILTRFPPEPNGYLHIGHAKSMFLNFKASFDIAKKWVSCIFRLDDTNPEAEDVEYIDSITEDVAWLGWTPCKTTYSSDYFGELYHFALELIKRGKAFVCHQTKEQVKQCRMWARELNTPGGRRDVVPESPWRDRSVEENLRLFDDMKKGKFGEGEAVLRLKMDMRSTNACMWDPVAYRIKYLPHPHNGDEWCIYPSYDFSHCLIDSLESIDYSLCTSEFETRRQTYYWVLEQLDIYRPYVWEFGRLNLTNTVMSKRKLKLLVMNRYVRGWDDPRMPTIRGFRRRGYTPEAINNFCEAVSITRTMNTNTDVALLEHCCRMNLEEIAPRGMAVLSPVKVVLENYPADKIETFTVPDYPRFPEKGSHTVSFQKTVFIDSCDFKKEDEKKFLGLAPGKVVALKYAYDIQCTGVSYKEDGSVDTISAKILTEAESTDLPKAASIKKKGNLNWVCGSALNETPLCCEARLYDHLFQEENPAALGDDWLDHLNQNSEIVMRNVYVDQWVQGTGKIGMRYQFERVGYFIIDLDTKPGHLVFNRILPLKVQKA